MKKINNTILVPTDFSEVCENAAFQAAALAEKLKSKLVLLHAINDQSPNDEEIEPKLEQFAIKLIEHYDITIDYIAKPGDIYELISKESEDLGVDILFFGSNGETGPQNINATKALSYIANMHCPTIITHQNKSIESYKNIILPITSDVALSEQMKWTVYVAKFFSSQINIFLSKKKTNNIEEISKEITNHLKKNKIEHTISTTEKLPFPQEIINQSSSISAGSIMLMSQPDTDQENFTLKPCDKEIIDKVEIPVIYINPRR